MGKKRTQSLINSNSDSESSSDVNIESDLLSLAKKRKRANNMGRNAAISDSESDSDWDQKKPNASANVRKKKRTKKVSKSSDSSEDWDKESDDDNAKKPEYSEKEKIQGNTKSESEQEEGEVSDSDNGEVPDANKINTDDSGSKSASHSESSASSSNSSSDSEFDDGYDENLMGDEEDRKRLSKLSEKERETEIFKRIEQRDIMRTRWEIERKLKLARRGEKDRRNKSKAGQKKLEKKKKEAAKKETKKKPDLEKKPAVFAEEIPNTFADPKSNQTASVTENTLSDPTNAVPSFKSQEESQEFAKPSSDTNLSDEQQTALAGGNIEYFDHKERSKERKKNVEMNRTDDKRSNAMALLKAKREGKAKREEEEARRQAEKEREEEKEELKSVSGSKSSVKLKASEIYSDDSGSSDWDEEKPEGRKRSRSSSGSGKSSSESEEEERKTEKRGTPIFISTREELNKLRLSRFKMERFINLPMFERIVMNCFVRISIGNNGAKPVYRVGEIVGVVETTKIYSLGKTRTNRGLRLKHGSQERVFRLEFISNQEFTDNEFVKWRDECSAQNIPLPTVDLIERKQNDIKEALNYEFKDEDVDKIIAEKQRFRNRPTNYAMRKTCLMKERDAAMLRGEYDTANELSQQIDELETTASELDKRRSGDLNLISYINDRNRKRNVEDAEKAIMEEARANRGQKISDPFTRRITQPRMGFRSADKKDEPDSLLASMPPPPPNRKKPEDCPVTTSSVSSSNSSKSNDGKEHSLYALHDFDIDLDVALPINPVNVLPKPVPKVSDTVPKRSLNLEDYKKKRGLI